MLRTVLADGLPARAAALGQRLRAGLEELRSRHEPIGDVRGQGLMLGVDMVSDRTTRVPAATTALMSLMGGTAYRTIADIEATPDKAPELAASITRWLVSAEIIRPEVVEIVSAIGRDHTGHQAGSRYADALVTPDYEPGLLSVITTRTVFHPGTYAGDHITCPSCGRTVSQDDMLDFVNQWYDSGDGIRVCTGCDKPSGINDWVWDPPWAFGHLGFDFVCWPPLKPDFVAKIADRLGHRVVLVDGYW